MKRRMLALLLAVLTLTMLTAAAFAADATEAGAYYIRTEAGYTLTVEDAARGPKYAVSRCKSVVFPAPTVPQIAMYFISARLLRLHKTLFYSTTSSRWKQDAKLPKNTASRLQTSRRHDTIEKRKGEGAAMNYAAIKNCDIANGPGVRVSLFVSGCRHHCKDCFNPETWDFACGEPFDEAVMDELLALLAPGYIRGITYLGGEPFEPENQPGLLELSRRIRAAYPEKSIWSFTGYLFDRDILAKKLGPWEVTQELLSYLDVLVDGPFVASLKNLNLRFRGSSNQRLIDVPASLKTGAVVLWDERQ